MDVVYVCRPGQNEELRYRLRSLRNLPHDKVVIAGGWPDWVRNVDTIAVERVGSKYLQTTVNLRAALRRVGRQFYLFNDDFFVMQHMEMVPAMHRGNLRDVASTVGPDYGRRMREIADWLEVQGFGALCYEVHAPMTLSRDRVSEILDISAPSPGRNMHKRSIYGNIMGLGGTLVTDFKTTNAEPWPFLSTNETIFTRKPVGEAIRSAFPDPSPYEEAA